MIERISYKDWGCQDVNNVYQWNKDVNQGTYGSVYKAINKKTKQVVALKKIKFTQDSQGFPITALREIQILKRLNHPNIIKLNDIVTTQVFKKDEFSSIYLVFDYFEHDFECLIKNKIQFNLSQIKYIMQKLFLGLSHLEDQQVLHRDIKSANIFYKNDGEIVIGDFGLSKIENNNLYTNYVVTLWYRAPELLLGQNDYNNKIDIWSIGCFMYELFTHEILFRGKNEKEQIQLIYDKCGTKIYDEAQNLQYYEQLKPQNDIPYKLKNFLYSKIENKFEITQTQTIDLMEKLLSFDPKYRISAKEALQHSFFQTQPLPSKMPKFNDQDFHGKIEVEINQNNQIPISTNKYGIIQKRNKQEELPLHRRQSKY